MALTDTAQQSVLQHFTSRPLRRSVDATCGNGHDTVFLAQHTQGRVWGFDVQQTALIATQQALDLNELTNVTLVHDGHQHIRQHIDGEIDCVMFNFGYLPSGDKTITTEHTSSVQALNAALASLSEHAVITLLCYPGHPAGAEETSAISTWLKALPTNISVSTHESIKPTATTPVLHVLYKEIANA